MFFSDTMAQRYSAEEVLQCTLNLDESDIDEEDDEEDYVHEGASDQNDLEEDDGINNEGDIKIMVENTESSGESDIEL